MEDNRRKTIGKNIYLIKICEIGGPGNILNGEVYCTCFPL
jgi:hypothetical protein